MKILLIEDNRTMAAAIKRQLKPNYLIEIASTGKAGITKVTENDYGLIILDLSLPDIPGTQVCKTIREKGITTPILILTGNSEVAARVSLLDMGADDYLTKPFNIEELRARLSALGRRSQKQYSEDIIEIKDLLINRTRREASRSGIMIPLRRKEFDILKYLVENRGRAMSRSMIMNNVWESGKESWNNTVDVHIKSLRDKIDRPFAIPIIKTAYGIGYMVDDDL